MPIRDMDAFGIWPEDEHRRVGANRGASGIDGLVASAFGFSIGSEVPTTAFIGDLSLLHDLNSLALIAKAETPVVLVVVNNDGGGIFHFLPVAEQTEHFEAFFATPHGIRMQPAAELFGLDFYGPRSMESFESAYQDAQAKARSALIEVTTDRRDNLTFHRRIEAAVRELSK
jgi:2-succinyl-5-enolpyruvyl-6-hydroxy-3-cyclohexene-1-carboxylate synthase